MGDYKGERGKEDDRERTDFDGFLIFQLFSSLFRLIIRNPQAFLMFWQVALASCRFFKFVFMQDFSEFF